MGDLVLLVADSVLLALVRRESFDLCEVNFHPVDFRVWHSFVVSDKRDVSIVKSFKVFHELEGTLGSQAAHDETFFAFELQR